MRDIHTTLINEKFSHQRITELVKLSLEKLSEISTEDDLSTIRNNLAKVLEEVHASKDRQHELAIAILANIKTS